MSASRFGQRFVVQSFGESHGPAVGVVVDGCPAGVPFDFEFLQDEMNRRRPGTSDLVSARNESDLVQVLSGVYQGKTLGTPIAMWIQNLDAQSQVYLEGQQQQRRGHADQVWLEKFGHVDPRGGGRSSGRETAGRVMAGAVAKMVMRSLSPKLNLRGCAKSIGSFSLTKIELKDFISDRGAESLLADSFEARFPSSQTSTELGAYLRKLKESGDSVGGEGLVVVTGLPTGLGQPVFHKLKADLASAILGVGAVNSFGFGDTHVAQQGTEFHQSNKQVYGGIQGGISNGETLIINFGVKPTSSILDVARKGRHDPCILIRAIPVIEAMVALTIVDHLLWTRTDRI